MPKLLVVDDDPLILDCFRHAFCSDQILVQTAGNAQEALSLVQKDDFDAIVTDLRLPGTSGLELLRELQQRQSRTPVILMTGHGTANTAIDAMRFGAFDYLLKPLDLDALQAAIDRALEASRMARTPTKIAADNELDSCSVDLIVGQCPAMQEVYRQIGRVAGQDVIVLILGESGTGKEVVARAIYQYSKRSDKQFLAINCAAIPENLLESELFGHEKGAFTGAERKRIGKFEQCDGGTLFLDEIGDMTPLTQTKVLRVLQDQQFERVGGSDLIRTNVRLIAATNRNLTEMMEQGTFRNDLYYRLNVYTIHLPPLRQRNGDLPLLIHYFLKRFSKELEKDVQRVSPEAMQLLEAYTWPGNLRELQSVLKHAVVEAMGVVILPESLPDRLRGTSGDAGSLKPIPSAAELTSDNELSRFIQERIQSGTEQLYDEVIQRVERTLLTELLHQVEGNISRASAILGISRSTLRVKLSALGIQLDRSVRVSD
ncbi:sigma-54-dependent transcriptional regulator [Schlesneria paludicola]|uniref:sigma-54-dependent transcriptional regulator n=1 Tax=Schlesneria paludicola TaxID=360056 RepID=UPI00029A8256|nr:sigma-54 dependent transcriptional regulator [Schlesneria paludicola]